MASKKGGLGRGLDSLFGDSAALQTPAPAVRPAEPKTPVRKTSAKKHPAYPAKYTCCVCRLNNRNVVVKRLRSGHCGSHLLSSSACTAVRAEFSGILSTAFVAICHNINLPIIIQNII